MRTNLSRKFLAATAVAVLSFSTAACSASVETTDDGVTGEIDTEEDAGTETETE